VYPRLRAHAKTHRHAFTHKYMHTPKHTTNTEVQTFLYDLGDWLRFAHAASHASPSQANTTTCNSSKAHSSSKGISSSYTLSSKNTRTSMRERSSPARDVVSTQSTRNTSMNVQSGWQHTVGGLEKEGAARGEQSKLGTLVGEWGMSRHGCHPTMALPTPSFGAPCPASAPPAAGRSAFAVDPNITSNTSALSVFLGF